MTCVSSMQSCFQALGFEITEFQPGSAENFYPKVNFRVGSLLRDVCGI